MPPDQGKTVEVLLDVLHRNPPAPHVVALFAVCPKLAAMNIGVAVGAFRARVAEHQVGVALAASHRFMHTPQGEFRLIVIKLRNVTNRFPSRKGMAILTRQGEIAVRAPRGGIGGSLRLGGRIRRRLRWKRYSSRTQHEPDDQV